MTEHEAYAVLELNDGESLDAIKKAYRKLALKHHPDRNQGSEESEEKFKQISDAYEYLMDYADFDSIDESNDGFKAEDEAKEQKHSASEDFENPFAYHHNIHERYKNGEFKEYEFKKRA